jgi:uncharacterized coiled-coil DUF342 family protein
MTSQEIMDQIESFKKKKNNAEGKVQVLSDQLEKLKAEYDGLVQFVYQYRNACWENPSAELRVSR